MTAKELKNALLQEAVQGKLVPQIASEGKARDLLEEIRKEKAKLIKHGKIKKEKPLSPITEDEIPFEIPESWCWCRFSELFQILNGDRGKNYPAKSTLNKTGIPFISALNLKNNTVAKDEDLLCLNDSQYEKLGNGKLQKDDMVVCIRGSLGKHGIYPFEKGAIASSLVIVRQYENSKETAQFLNIYLDTPLFFQEISNYDNGTAQPNLAAESFKQFLFPLPPLPEQKRIVAVVEQFMPLIEEYDKKESELNVLNKEIAKKLKNAILQEAVQGKLVPQINAEGNAKDLLEEIKKEKANLIKEGTIKKEKPLPEITEDEIPFDIPENWCWCRLGEISTNITAGGDKPSHFSKTITEKLTVPVISNGEKDDGVFGYTDRATVTEKAITVSGRGNIGFTKVRSEPFMPIVRLITITFPNILDFKYLEIVISFLVTDGNGSAVQQLTVPMIKPLLIPLPPLAEQKRIVAAIEKILPLCEKLGE